MLNKVLVAKFLTAMTLAGFATGAAAAVGDDPADDGETIELETPFTDDDESTSSDDATTDDESEEADDSESDEADEEAAEDEAEAEEDAAESADDAVVEEPKAPTHGSIVSNCARNTEETGRAKGQAVSTVAKDDTAECVGLPEQSAGDEEKAPAPAEDADEADADDEDAEEEPRAAKAQGADHRNGKATAKLAGRDARKAGR